MTGSSPLRSDSAEPLLQGDRSADLSAIPDDFKYGATVAECAIDVRHQFLRRVYTILVAQLAATVGISAFLMTSPTAQHWVLTHQWTMWVSVIGSFGAMIGAMVMQRKYPWNMVFLGAFTLAESYLVGISTSMLDTRVVVDAFVITAFVFGCLTLFALQTRYDFTGWVPYLSAGLFSLLGLGLIAMFSKSNTLELAYSYVAVVLFSGFIIVDTQMILTRFSVEDEVPAAIQLYLDILNLFMNILRILSDQQDN